MVIPCTAVSGDYFLSLLLAALSLCRSAGQASITPAFAETCGPMPARPLCPQALAACALHLSDPRVLLLDHDGAVLQSKALKSGAKLSGWTLDYAHELIVSVDMGKEAKVPHQAFLRASHIEGGVSTYTLGSVKPNGTISWKLTSGGPRACPAAAPAAAELKPSLCRPFRPNLTPDRYLQRGVQPRAAPGGCL